MKKYEYVNIKLKNNVVKDAVSSEHRKVIDEYAQKGFTYVSFVPSRLGPSGKIVEMDLIFETEV